MKYSTLNLMLFIITSMAVTNAHHLYELAALALAMGHHHLHHGYHGGGHGGGHGGVQYIPIPVHGGGGGKKSQSVKIIHFHEGGKGGHGGGWEGW